MRLGPLHPRHVQVSSATIHRHFPGVIRTRLGPIEFFWVVLDYIGLYWVVFGCVGLYWVVLGLSCGHFILIGLMCSCDFRKKMIDVNRL